MAELHVEPKKNKSWWLWLILAIVAIGLLFYFMRGSDRHDGNTTETTTTTTTTTTDTTTNERWRLDNLNRKVPAAAYEEITDKNIELRGNENYAIYSLVLFDSARAPFNLPP